MALLRLIGVIDSTGRQKLQESGDTFLASDYLNVGSATAATATGDLAAGDGTRNWSFDASGGRVALTGINTSQSSGHHYLY